MYTIKRSLTNKDDDDGNKNESEKQVWWKKLYIMRKEWLGEREILNMNSLGLQYCMSWLILYLKVT